MSEGIFIDKAASKKEKYHQLFPQLVSLTEAESDVIANASNVIAALKEVFDLFWVGIYFVKNTNDKEELVLGPFQGPIACTRIAKGRGVCGTSWEKKETIIVPDVENFPGHIACSSLSKSEIVVPVLSDENVMAVIDVDSDELNSFDADDQQGLEQIASLLAAILKSDYAR